MLAFLCSKHDIRMKKKITQVLLYIAIICVPLNVDAQRKVFTYENKDEYFTIELDDDEPITWGTYRALNHHKIPYFEITFISSQKQNNKGDTLLIMVPTFYSYSYHSEIQGVSDTINKRNQDVRFHFYVRDKGKKLEYIELDSITRERFIEISSFDIKNEVDITSIPPFFKLTKKPKWSRFPSALRTNLAARLKEHKKKNVKY